MREQFVAEVRRQRYGKKTHCQLKIEGNKNITKMLTLYMWVA